MCAAATRTCTRSKVLVLATLMLLGITNVQQATAFDKAVKRTKKTGGDKSIRTMKKASQTKDRASTAQVASSSDTPAKTMDKPTNKNNNNNKPTRKKNNNKKKKVCHSHS